MPYKSKTICSHPGCENLSDGSLCEAHRTEQRLNIDRLRGTASARGYDLAWRKLRGLKLNENPFCEECGKFATEVHHIKKITDHPELRLSYDNLSSQCKSCHSKKTARGE